MMERVSLFVNKEDYRRLKAKLALMGKSISGWFREIIKEFIEE